MDLDPRELSQEVLLGPVFDALPVGVVVLDERGLVKVFNEHEEKLANRVRERVLGRPFFEDIAPCMNVRELAGQFFDKVRSASLDTKVEFSFGFPHAGQPRDVLVKMLSVIVGGKPHGLLLIEDVSMTRAVERMKESLANLLVHDFKNPLSVIRTNMDFVRSTVTDQVLLEAIDDSVNASKQLSSMVLNLLDVARLETSTFPLVRARADVSALVAATVRANVGMARASDIELVDDAATTIHWALDAGAIGRCLTNLVDNAIRHAPARSRIVVSASVEGGGLVLRVTDQGPGVPQELRATIFDKFAQGALDGRSSDNRGLGLTFVRMAARAHGGDVSVSDTVPHGATFELRLPAPP